MKIIETKRAPNPRRVRVFLAEKGINIEYEEIELMQLEHKSEDFAALNPVQRVPVLILDDGTAISESIAICRYFEEMQPEPCLMGKGIVGRAQVEMWQRIMEIDLFRTVQHNFRHSHPRMEALESPQISQWAEINKGRVLSFLGVLDKRLADRPYIAGDEYSIADITGMCAIDFMAAPGIEMPSEYKNIARWHSEVASRPSAQA